MTHPIVLGRIDDAIEADCLISLATAAYRFNRSHIRDRSDHQRVLLAEDYLRNKAWKLIVTY